MQALSYIPHIVADIFAFYTLSPKRFITIIRRYFGGVGRDEHLNECMFMAARIWAAQVRARGYILDTFDPDEPDDVKIIKCDDLATRIRISDGTGRVFDAIASPKRFPSLHTLIAERIYSDCPPTLKGIVAMDGFQTDIPLGLEHLVIKIDSCDPLNGKDITDEVLASLKTLGLNYMYKESWWPGVTRMLHPFSHGPAPKQASEIVKKIPDVYDFLVANPLAQLDLVDLRCKISGNSYFRIKRAKGGAPILPIIEDNAIDFTNIEGIIKLECMGFERMTMPQDIYLLKSIFIDGAQVIEADEPLIYTHSVVVDSQSTQDALIHLVPHMERFEMTDGGEALKLAAPFVTHIKALYNRGAILDCPRLEQIRTHWFEFAELYKDWYTLPSKFTRIKPLSAGPPYKKRFIEGGYYYSGPGRDDVTEYRVDAPTYDRLHAKFATYDLIVPTYEARAGDPDPDDFDKEYFGPVVYDEYPEPPDDYYWESDEEAIEI